MLRNMLLQGLQGLQNQPVIAFDNLQYELVRMVSKVPSTQKEARVGPDEAGVLLAEAKRQAQEAGSIGELRQESSPTNPVAKLKTTFSALAKLEGQKELEKEKAKRKGGQVDLPDKW